MLPAFKKKPWCTCLLQGCKGQTVPIGKLRMGQQGGREERDLQWETQEWWGQGGRHECRITSGFSGKTGAERRYQHELLVEEGEAEPERTDAIENWVREERPGEKGLNQSGRFDLIQCQRRKPAERLLQGREEDLISHTLHGVKWQ